MRAFYDLAHSTLRSLVFRASSSAVRQSSHSSRSSTTSMVGDWFLPPEHQGPTVLGSSFGSRTGEDSVGLEGAKQSGSHSGGTGVDNRQGVAPRGPMRGEAAGGGRAEAQTPKPLSELGSAKALVWQGAASCSSSVARHRATVASCDST